MMLSFICVCRMAEMQNVEDLIKAKDRQSYAFKCPASSKPLEIIDTPRKKSAKVLSLTFCKIKTDLLYT